MRAVSGHGGREGRGPASWRPVLTASDVAVIAALSALVLVTFAWSDSTFLLPTSEDLAEMAPYRRMVAEAFRGGWFPLWTPQILCGLPLAAWPHSSALYPLGFIFGLWDYARALPVNLCVHLAIFGLGLMAMLRSLSIRREAALLAAVFVTFGPVATYWEISFLPTIYTGAWAPWLFAFGFLLVRSQRWPYVFGLAASFALQAAGGRYDLTARELIIMGCMGAALLAVRRGRRGAMLWVPALAAGGLLAAALLLIHYEYVARSIRSIPFSPQYFRHYQRDFRHVVLFFFWVMTPSAVLGLIGARRGRRRLMAGAGMVIGVCLLWLIAPGWWLKAAFHLPLLDKLMWPNVSLLFAFMALAVIAGEGMGTWIERAASAAALITPAALAAGFAPIFVTMGVLAHKGPPNANELYYYLTALFDKTPAGVALGAVAVILAFLYLRRRGGGAPAAAERHGAGAMLAACSLIVGCDVLGGALLGMMHFPCSARPYIGMDGAPAEGLRKWRSLDLFPWSDWRTSTVLARSAADRESRTIDGFISMPVREYGEFLSLIAPSALSEENGRLASEQFMSALKEGEYISPGSIPLLDFLNVGTLLVEGTNIKLGPVYHFAWAPESNFRREGEWEEDKRGMRWEQSGPGGWEGSFPSVPGFRFQSRIAPESAAPVMVEVRQAAGGGRLNLLYARAFSLGGRSPGLDVALPLPAAKDYVLQGAALPVTGAGFRLAWLDPRLFSRERAFQLASRKGGVDTLVNPGALPQAFAVHETAVVPDRGQRLSYLLEHGERLGEEAVLEAGPGAPMQDAGPAGDEVRIEDYGAQAITLRAGLGGAGLVVMSDVYYPGWRAWDGGRESRILRADHAFRAIWLDRGAHRIVMRFEPAGFRVGLWVSLASILMAAAAAITAMRGRRSRAIQSGEKVDSRGGP